MMEEEDAIAHLPKGERKRSSVPRIPAPIRWGLLALFTLAGACDRRGPELPPPTFAERAQIAKSAAVDLLNRTRSCERPLSIADLDRVNGEKLDYRRNEDGSIDTLLCYDCPEGVGGMRMIAIAFTSIDSREIFDISRADYIYSPPMCPPQFGIGSDRIIQ